MRATRLIYLIHLGLLALNNTNSERVVLKILI